MTPTSLHFTLAGGSGERVRVLPGEDSSARSRGYTVRLRSENFGIETSRRRRWDRKKVVGELFVEGVLGGTRDEDPWTGSSRSKMSTPATPCFSDALDGPSVSKPHLIPEFRSRDHASVNGSGSKSVTLFDCPDLLPF